MVAIGLIGSTMAMLRAWAGSGWWWIGELAPLMAIGLGGLAMAVLTSGRFRRFSVGLATSGVVLGLAVWVAPIPVRDTVFNRVIFPPDVILFHPVAEDWLFDLPDHYFNIRPIRYPFCTHESQEALGLLVLSVAVIGGLLALIPRPRKSRPSVTIDS
jgi:hypothetical protein